MNTVENNVIHIHLQCRICLSGDRMQNICNGDNEKYNYFSIKIMFCTSNEVKFDELPILSCLSCADQIEKWYKFVQQCECSDTILYQYTNKLPLQMEPEQNLVIKKKSHITNLVMQENRSELSAKETHKSSFEMSLHSENIDKDLQSSTIMKSEHIDYVDGFVYPICEMESSLEDNIEYDSMKDESGKQDLKHMPRNTPVLKRKSVKKNRRKGRNQCASSADGIRKQMYHCRECTKTFSSRSGFRDHKAMHRGERRYVCQICNKHFYSSSKLHRHETTHRNERPYVCDVCGKSYKSNGDLKSHLPSHSGERPFLCSVCGKSFKVKSVLTDHLRCHSGEKPFICHICGKSFSKKRNLTDHSKIHTGEKPFVCNLCEKAFTYKSGLTKHGSVHTREKPFLCTFCNRAFADKWHLTQHLRLHTGEKPYVCHICDQSFTHNVSLREHVRQHSGKLWSCELCGKSYSSRSSLTAHTKQMHR